MSATPDLVVLLDEDGRPCGTAPRASVHTTDTPLHLAFSCYVLDDDDRLLLTRRAVTKRTWPGVWTNSFCGHPRPEEDPVAAVHRYAGHELGLQVTDVRCVLPRFRYRAVDPGGIVENELCPVYVARTDGTPRHHPDEVEESVWLPLDRVRAALDAAPWALSPWLREQAAELEAADWFAAPTGATA
ncbi:isopentenyl-diphosphate Delta-isomerase [Nocardioides sp. SOB77]|uniref:Isopentenyl-diphosphate Delta-isomerase n=1 Tax=Nocardioides oceani TaxID=3058369 RepID=A0ABT8FD26_9ACTN|nr:isopentenyl-diphosphate Delta-isomerase [Nocardioides oceani]MDN4172465.1 isopentenyl-diphosphate Delta-isomerase [Nocardioides oceani]